MHTVSDRIPRMQFSMTKVYKHEMSTKHSASKFYYCIVNTLEEDMMGFSATTIDIKFYVVL